MGVPHDDLGKIDEAAYAALRRAFEVGTPDAFTTIPLGVGDRELAEPQGALAVDLIGPIPQSSPAEPAQRLRAHTPPPMNRELPVAYAAVNLLGALVATGPAGVTSGLITA